MLLCAHTPLALSKRGRPGFTEPVDEEVFIPQGCARGGIHCQALRPLQGLLPPVLVVPLHIPELHYRLTLLSTQLADSVLAFQWAELCSPIG